MVVKEEFEKSAPQTERTRPLIDWTDDFEKRLVYHVVAGSVLADFPDLIDAQLFGGEDPSTHTAGGPASIIVQAALDYYKKHRAAPGSQISDVIAALRRNKDLIPLVQSTWDAIVEHEAANPTLYDEMKVHLPARCLYRAARQKALQEAEWLAKGEFETIEEYSEKQKDLLERIERIEKAGNLKTPLRLTKASDFTAPPVEWVIANLIPKGMLSMTAGKDGTGKSLLTMEMGKCVLPGGPAKFLGHAVATTGPVIILAMDDPDPLINDRLIAMGIKDHPDLYVPQDIDYSDPIKLLRHLLKLTEEVDPKPVLVIVDCLYRLLPQKANANNDAAQMVPLLNLLNTVAEKSGAAVIIIHHLRKAGDEIAGSYAIRAGLKTLFSLTNPQDKTKVGEIHYANEAESPDTAIGPARRNLTLEKSKVTRDGTVWALQFNGPGDWCLMSPSEIAQEKADAKQASSPIAQRPTETKRARAFCRERLYGKEMDSVEFNRLAFSAPPEGEGFSVWAIKEARRLEKVAAIKKGTEKWALTILVDDTAMAKFRLGEFYREGKR